MAINVIVNGAKGRMGRTTVAAITAADGLDLVAASDKDDDLTAMVAAKQADVVVDFTNAAVALENAEQIIAAGARPVIGTSGLKPEQVAILQEQLVAKQLGGIIAPNFSIGAVLMMMYAKHAARFLPHAEIIELHHDGKLDAPSGTAMRTAELIAEGRTEAVSELDCHANVEGARGAYYADTPIHAVRLPGLVAHQTVMFGGHSESLTIKHDSLNRESFMPGVILACKKVMALQELIVGLEHFLD